MCVECLIGKQKKPILFKVTEPSSIPYRTHSACAKMAAYPDPPPIIPVPESIAAQAAYQLRYKNTEYCSCHGRRLPMQNVTFGEKKEPLDFICGRM